MKITQAVIAAGGFGTRLRPFTDTAPKPMIPVLGKPLLEWHIAQFKKHGVTDFICTLHYLPEVIKDHLGNGSKFGVKIEYCFEEEPMDSAGALKLAAEKLDQCFYYIYGDIFSLVDYSAMRNTYAHLKNPIGLQRVERTDLHEDADIAELDDKMRFVALHHKPHTQKYDHTYRLRGVSIFEKEICSYVSDGASSLSKDVLPSLIAAGKYFYGYECHDYSKGIDTLEKRDQVESHLISKKVRPWW